MPINKFALCEAIAEAYKVDADRLNNYSLQYIIEKAIEDWLS